MKILFFFRYPGMLRYYQTLFRALLKRGHTCHICFSNLQKQAQDGILETICDEYPAQLTYDKTPKIKDPWRRLNEALAWGMDYLRYLSPTYKNSWRLRRRLEIRVAPDYQKLVTRVFPFNTCLVHKMLISFFRFIYDTTPVPDVMVELIKKYSPDIVFVSPLVLPGSTQGDFFKAARLLGVPSIYSTLSWDNLTTKGLIRGNPDRIFVWNDIQKKEAINMHGIAHEKIVVTGSQYFDLWFDARPTNDRVSFCKKVGLDSGKPFVLYLCSSNFMAPDEKELIKDWIHQLRSSSNSALREVGVLIRPYPETVENWKDEDIADETNVSYWPRKREYPIKSEFLGTFFDSIFHSCAVIGLNTTAMIESVIVGRPVLSLMRQEGYNQSNTLHFNYLRRANGGFLIEAENISIHLKQLEEVLQGKCDIQNDRENFLKSFIRPHGMQVSGSQFFADELEQFQHSRKGKIVRKVSLFQKVVVCLLFPLNILLLKYRKTGRWRKHIDGWRTFREILEANNDDIVLAEKILKQRSDK